MDSTRAYCEIDGCSSVGIHQVHGKITCNMYKCNQKAKEDEEDRKATVCHGVNTHCGCDLCLALLKPDRDKGIKEMKEITHVFKVGDWIDCSEISKEQVKAILSKAFNDGVKLLETDVGNICNKLMITHCNRTYFTAGRAIESMEQDYGIKPNKLTWDDITKPIETETPWLPKLNEVCFVSLLEEENWVKGCVTGALGELIYFEKKDGVEVLKEKEIKFKPLSIEKSTPVDEVADKPYTPKAGEIFEVDMGDYLAKALYIGIDYKGRHTYQFIEGDIEGKVYYDKNTDLFHPIKSEREKLIALALKVSKIPHEHRCIFEELVDAGWRPTNKTTYSVTNLAENTDYDTFKPFDFTEMGALPQTNKKDTRPTK